jgi:hypothetical protein
MLCLRRRGWSLSALGRKYNVDHTSIRYQCQKWGTDLPKTTAPERTFRDLPLKGMEKDKYANLLYERVNQGKSYQEYKKGTRKVAPFQRKNII